MDGRMDGWMDGWMDVRPEDTRKDGLMNGGKPDGYKTNVGQIDGFPVSRSLAHAGPVTSGSLVHAFVA